MKYFIPAAMFAGILAALSVIGGAQKDSADLILKNGNIYTVNDAQPKAEAVAVKGSKIVFAGSNKDS